MGGASPAAASPDDSAPAAASSSELNEYAPAALAAGRDVTSEEATAHAIAQAARDRIPPFSTSAWRFLPFALLFCCLFMTLSLASTGTLTYGLASPGTQKAFMGQVNRAKIFVQELAGLRPRPQPAKVTPLATSAKASTTASAAGGGKKKKRQQAAREEDGGYGGITRKKKKKKKKRTQPVPGSVPIDFTGGGDATATHATVAAPSPSADEYEEVQAEEAPPLVVQRPAEVDPTALYLTPEQLAQYRGDDGGPIFLAVHGRIFDVSEGRDFYGPHAGYSNLAGKDCSRAFATNCYNNRDLHDLRGLTPDQRRAIDGWYKFYAEHAKYRPVGWLDAPPVPDDAPMPIDTC